MKNLSSAIRHKWEWARAQISFKHPGRICLFLLLRLFHHHYRRRWQELITTTKQIILTKSNKSLRHLSAHKFLASKIALGPLPVLPFRLLSCRFSCPFPRPNSSQTSSTPPSINRRFHFSLLVDICLYWFKFKFHKLNFHLNSSHIVLFPAKKRTGRIRSGGFGDFELRDGDEDD